MPTTYAHDLFGKKIYAKLPAEIQKVIRRNTNLYRIGLHGPDILFYDMLKPKVTETGIAMHRECAAPFFERGMTLVRTTHDEKLLAYLLGFGCHYLLDSACHPFVYEMAEDVYKRQETGSIFKIYFACNQYDQHPGRTLDRKQKDQSVL